MTTEDVIVTVGQEHSHVSGRYSFQQLPDDWPYRRDIYVIVYVPVLLQTQGVQQYEKRFDLPVVTVRGKRYAAHIRNDLALEDTPRSGSLPKGWFMGSYEVKIPLALIAKNFEIQVEYMQPNFPGKAAGYVPIRPPDDATTSKIVFVPLEGYALRPRGLLSCFKPKQSRFEFTPQDRKLLTARLVRH